VKFFTASAKFISILLELTAGVPDFIFLTIPNGGPRLKGGFMVSRFDIGESILYSALVYQIEKGDK